jgi:hypothetical protein
MEKNLLPDPQILLEPLGHYIVEDLSNADASASATLAAQALDELSEAVLAMLADSGADDVSCQFFPDPDEPGTPGNLYIWPTTRTSQVSTYEDAHNAEYSLRAAIFLSEREDADVIYPPGFSLVLKLQESACELIKELPPAVFEKLEFRLKGSALPAGFEFLDDSQHLPVIPNMRRQFLKAIERAHAVTRNAKRSEFESVMLHYIWDETEPKKDFTAVLSTLIALFAAVHWQAKQ